LSSVLVAVVKITRIEVVAMAMDSFCAAVMVGCTELTAGGGSGNWDGRL
jgi:hypothetical protein